MNPFNILEVNNLMEIELDKSVPLEENKVTNLKELAKLNFIPEFIYYNDHLITIADQTEYEELLKIGILNNTEEAILLRISQFNIFIWAGDYSKNQQLKELLKLEEK